MHCFKTLVFMTFLAGLNQAQAMIFDEDDRLERFQLKEPQTLSYSKSTAALMLRSQLDQVQKDGQTVGFQIDLGKPGNGPVPESGSCKRAFVGQPQLTGYCSSTLIGEDLLITAGHCLNRGEDVILPKEICKQTVAVFDYAYTAPLKQPLRFAAKNVYSCKRVEFYSASAELDIAVIRLDRPVKGREIFKLKKTASRPMDIGQILHTSGYPRGMPNKTVLSAKLVKYHTEPAARNTARFYADVMGGSSGSSVIDPLTREIVGILVSSDCNDTEYDSVNQCFYEPTFHYQCLGVEMTLLEKVSDLVSGSIR